MKQHRTILPVVDVSPPELDLFDLDERDQLRNEIYCEELAAAMLAVEMDPKNFFRLAKPKRRGL